MIPLRQDLPVLSIGTSFIWERGFLNGLDPYDFTGHSARLQVRRYPGAPDVLIDLATVTSAAQGIRFYKINPAAVLDGMRITIAKTALSALPGLGLMKSGESRPFAYDLLMTVPGQAEQAWLFGDLIQSPGVTR